VDNAEYWDLMVPQLHEEASNVGIKPDVWKVLIVDDEESVHQITHLVLRSMTFENKKIALIDAYSDQEARQLIEANPDTAVVLLDVIMEKENSGLEFVHYLRTDLKNMAMRIILRTGHPGKVPEQYVIKNYDVNGYKNKLELTHEKFMVAMTIALRSFRDLRKLNLCSKEIEIQVRSLSPFVPAPFLKLIAAGDKIPSQLEEKVAVMLTVLCIGVHASTSGEADVQIPSREMFDLLNGLIAHIEPTVLKGGGAISCHGGNQLIVLFLGDADGGIAEALAVFARVQQFDLKRYSRRQSPLYLGMGMSSSMVLAAMQHLGDHYTSVAIGKALLVASQLELLTVKYEATILVDGETAAKIGEQSSFPLCDIRLKQCTKRADLKAIYGMRRCL
jgi:CheY-like chemotaxis protein/class 3 adenylate cyclase